MRNRINGTDVSNTFLTGLLVLTFFVLFWGQAHAATITLYAEPKSGSKVVAKSQDRDKLIKIFAPKADSKWLKVADTSNGNVGWVLRSTFGKKSRSDVASPPTYHQKITEETNKDGKGPYSYKTFEYSGTQKMTEDEARQLMSRFEARQRRMMENMDKMMESFTKDFGGFSFFDGFGPDQDFFGSPFNRPRITTPENDQVIKVPKKKTPPEDKRL